MNKKLVIIGAGGHGKVCANVAEDMNLWDDIVFLDDHKQGLINGHKIIGKIHLDNLPEPNAYYFVGIGDSKIREKFTLKLQSLNASLATLIHPTAYISQYHSMGEGTIVMPHVVINTNAQVGSGVIINSGSIVEHDNQISDYAHISPGVTLSGNVLIGKHTWIGSGSIIINNIDVSSDVFIGAHSLVNKDIIKPGVYYGTPIVKRS